MLMLTFDSIIEFIYLLKLLINLFLLSIYELKCWCSYFLI
jgi:hypothetical protein